MTLPVCRRAAVIRYEPATNAYEIAWPSRGNVATSRKNDQTLRM